MNYLPNTPGIIPPIPPIDIDALKASICKDSFYDFLLEFWDEICPHKLIDNWHIKFICDELQKVGFEVINGQVPEYDYYLINIPPGMSKSTIASQLFPVWLWINKPSIRIISSSYSFDIALGHSVKSRDCINSDKFKNWYGHIVKLKPDQNAKRKYENTAMGDRFTTSSGGSATGAHGDIEIVDDPHKPPDPEKEEAGASSVEMASQVSWHWQTLDSRKTDEAKVPVLVIMQRLHDLDLAGDIIRKAEEGGLRLRHICLPSEALEEYPIKPEEAREYYNANNGILDPNRKGKEVLEAKRIKIGSTTYATQYGQVTAPGEGGIVKKTWFGFYDKEDLPRNLTPHFTMDTAMGNKSKTKKADPSDPYGILSAKFNNGNAYLLNFQRVKVEVPDYVNFIIQGTKALEEDYPNQVKRIISMLGKEREMYSNDTPFLDLFGGVPESYCVIESKSSGSPIRQFLRKAIAGKYAIVSLDPGSVSKMDRIKTQSPKIEAGRVFLPRGNVRMRIKVGKDAWIDEMVEPWVPSFIDEVAGFPNRPHDEAVDCLEMLLRKLIDLFAFTSRKSSGVAVRRRG